ncbi:MAG: ABC transporter substrate-binding protein [Thiotrichales bacterium]|nr:ABC transporter substrate-binding protein [Thiotrichales bacterium]
MNDFEKQDSYKASEVRRMKADYEDGGLNRRQFLQGLMAVGLSATAATAIVAGSRDVRAMTPKKGGRIRVGWSTHGPTDTLDPILFTEGLAYSRGRAHLNNLVQFNDDLSVRPELAENIDVSADASEFTFELRKGVTWHDGKDFTADDVVYSMNRHRGDDSVSKAKTLVGMVSEWKKVDNHTVKAILSSPNADLLPTLATFHFKIVQDGAEEKEGYFNKVIGTGPFTCEEFTPGVRSVSKRNPNYWREGPNVDEIELFGITDQVSRQNALASGDIHMMSDLDFKSIKQVESNDEVRVVSAESGAYTNFVLMLDRSPGNNPDFVETIKLIQNRTRLVRSVLKGQGGPGNDHPIGPAYGVHHCESLEQTELDHDKASFHLKKSGISEMEVLTSDAAGAGANDMTLLMQSEATKIGLNLSVKRVPSDGYWGTVWMNSPFHVSGWNMRPTAYVMLELAYGPEAPWNESVWKNERMGMLLEAARSSTDEGARKDMFCEMQGLIRAEAGSPLPMHSSYVDAVSAKIQGVPGVPLAQLGGCEWPEYVWLDD